LEGKQQAGRFDKGGRREKDKKKKKHKTKKKKLNLTPLVGEKEVKKGN